MLNLVVQIVTAICFAALVIYTAAGLSKIFKGRYKRLSFLRSFKKGRFAIIYVTAIPLYYIGHVYAGQDYVESFFNAIAKIIELVVLKYDFGSIEALMNSNAFYRITVYFCFIMAGLNVILVTVSFANQRIWEFFTELKIKYCHKNKLFIFGSNPENESIRNSDKERCKVIIDKISAEDRERFYLNKVSYLAEMSDKEAVSEIFKKRRLTSLIQKAEKLIKHKNADAVNTVVINTGSDERNMLLCRDIIDRLSKYDEAGREKLFETLKVFVFGDPKYEAIYEDIESDGFGCISYLNKYKKIGIDFIERYPLAFFMNENQIDYETSLIKKGVEINFFMLCFGKFSRQIFLTSVANNQFLTEGENGPELKMVNYHIFDKEIAENNKNLNHNYYRFKHEFEKCDKSQYLPLPSFPAHEDYHHLDINDGELYKCLKDAVCRSGNDANFVLISFGNDLENIDMAQKLLAKKKEWGVENLVIFVRARTWTKEQTFLENDGCYFIGNENEIVYNIDKILSDSIQKIALMRNEDYYLQKATKNMEEITAEFIEEKKKQAFREWHTEKNRIERESNIYAALSMRAKLNLMGLDYCKVDENEEPALTEDEYFAVYAKNDMPDSKVKARVTERKLVDFDIDFKKSRRHNMAILEHYRWNSFLITKGFVPSSKEDIMKEHKLDENGKYVFTNGKDYSLRRHGNLTTYDGLIEFRKMIAERDKISEKDADVINYDYQILDDTYYFLKVCGYKIIRKKNK